MQGINNQEPNPNSSMTITPQPLRQHLYRQNSAEHHRRDAAQSSLLAMVTPSGPGTSMEQWMAGSRMRRYPESYNNVQRYITPVERAEVSRAVYGILRNNLPPALEAQTSQEELTLIADSIESKLYQTAFSPHAYCAFSTLDFRITALATAVLIHSDKGDENGVSEACAKLSAAARKSLVHCVMVLFSYEKKKLDQSMPRRRPDNLGLQPHHSTAVDLVGQIERYDNCGGLDHAGAGNRIMIEDSCSHPVTKYKGGLNHTGAGKRVEGSYSHPASDCPQYQKQVSTASGDSDNRINAQIALKDSKRVQPFPPSA